MEDLISKVNKIKDVIDYQKEAIVSRMLINKKTGTVTVFAFDKGQSLSEHTASFDALVHIIDGNAEIMISGEKYYLDQGSMIIMPANEPHAVHAVDKFKMILVMIKS